MFFRGINKQKGVTLLMSMLIMTTVVAVSIGVSVVIINQYQLSSNIDQSITAFYAAESGLELSLSTVKTNRNNSTSLTTAKTQATTSGGFPAIGASYSVIANTSEKYILSYLKKNEKITVDLFEPDNLPGSGSGADVGSLIIDWSDDCYGAGWLKLGYTAIKPDGTFDSSASPYENIYPCCAPPACTPPATTCTTVTDNRVTPGFYYRLNLTPIDCNVRSLKISAYSQDNGAGASRNFSNRLFLKSTGTKGSSKIALAASVPWYLPAQGIFDFVLFSETTLKKE